MRPCQVQLNHLHKVLALSPNSKCWKLAKISQKKPILGYSAFMKLKNLPSMTIKDLVWFYFKHPQCSKNPVPKKALVCKRFWVPKDFKLSIYSSFSTSRMHNIPKMAFLCKFWLYLGTQDLEIGLKHCRSIRFITTKYRIAI